MADLWSRQRCQDRADDFGVVGAQPERAIRETARIAAEGIDDWPRFGELVGRDLIVPWAGQGVSQIKLALPASWGSDRFVLQLVFEEQIREQIEASTDRGEAG